MRQHHTESERASQRASEPARRSSYKLIPWNNNPCPHLLQHASPALAINQQIPAAAICRVEAGDGAFVGSTLCNRRLRLNAVHRRQIELAHAAHSPPEVTTQTRWLPENVTLHARVIQRQTYRLVHRLNTQIINHTQTFGGFVGCVGLNGNTKTRKVREVTSPAPVLEEEARWPFSTQPTNNIQLIILCIFGCTVTAATAGRASRWFLQTTTCSKPPGCITVALSFYYCAVLHFI